MFAIFAVLGCWDPGLVLPNASSLFVCARATPCFIALAAPLAKCAFLFTPLAKCAFLFTGVVIVDCNVLAADDPGNVGLHDDIPYGGEVPVSRPSSLHYQEQVQKS